MSVTFVDRVDGLPVERVEYGRGINGVIGCFLEESFASPGNKFGDGWFGKLAVERIGDGTKSRQEHTPLIIRTAAQTISNVNALTIGTNEFSSRHK